MLSETNLVEALETLIVSGDRIVPEGGNQKQTDFLSRSLFKVDPGKLHHLRLIISSIGRPDHLILFELDRAKRVAFPFADRQSLRASQLLWDGEIETGAMPRWTSTCSI